MLRTFNRFMHYQTALDKAIATKAVNTFKESYDYIIVGGGAAGNVLSCRLTEDEENRVLLLEGGADETSPGASHAGFKTVPQERACRGLINRQMNYTSARGLGGLESINYLSYTRGSRYDYDEWEELGCTGWSYKDILPYIIKSESNSNEAYVKSGYHGDSGPMKISDLSETRLVKAFLAAGRELGYDITDVNGRNQLGFSNGQGYIHEGTRFSTAHAYRLPALERPNLDFAINANVRKILVEDGRAVGVQLVKGGNVHQIKANKEVIVSAGAIESPHVLLLSGIGPAAHLDRLGIKVESNVPVGEHLQDHPMVVVEYMLRRPTRSLELEQSTSHSDHETKLNVLYTKEKMNQAQGAIAFLRTRLAPENRLYPDIMLQLGNTLIGQIFKNIWNMRNEVWQSLYKHPDNKTLGMYISTLLLHPKSVGTVKLQGPDPTLEPLIDPKFLHHEDDATALKEGLKLQFQLLNTDALREIGAELSPFGLPGVADSRHGHGSSLYSDEYLERFIRSQTLTAHHPAGTCKMGSPSDPSAVVDPQLRVFGVTGLRVVDASVMPNVPSGNTSASTIMIAEKAADMIRGVNTVKNIRIPDEVLEGIDTQKEKSRI